MITLSSSFVVCIIETRAFLRSNRMLFTATAVRVGIASASMLLSQDFAVRKKRGLNRETISCDSVRSVGRGNMKGKRPRGPFSSKTVSDMIKDEVAQ